MGPGYALGHRRLAIIDLSAAGRQPMANEDGSVELILNGEIYNFQDLRPALEQGPLPDLSTVAEPGSAEHALATSCRVADQCAGESMAALISSGCCKSSQMRAKKRAA